MKYIDADKIKAEIERLRKENNNIRCESNKAYCQGYGDAFIDLLSSLDTLEKSVSEEQPSLPDNLDDAANSYASKTECAVVACRGFKAGAEWMARQGLVSEGIV